MRRTTYPLGGHEILVSNIAFLLNDDAELPLSYTVHPAEPDVGIFLAYTEWNIDADTLTFGAEDEDGEPAILHLPVGGPAMRSLLTDRMDERLQEHCSEHPDGEHIDWLSDQWKRDRDDRLVHGIEN